MRTAKASLSCRGASCAGQLQTAQAQAVGQHADGTEGHGGGGQPGDDLLIRRVKSCAIVEGLHIRRIMQREFPLAPLVGVGVVIVQAGRVLLARRGNEPLKGHWTLPGGLLELGESLSDGVMREVREETGLNVEVVELIELVDRIHRLKEDQGARVRYHYVIADYLCRVVGGQLQAASDADAVRWVEREEWSGAGALQIDPITARVIEAGWQKAQELEGR